MKTEFPTRPVLLSMVQALALTLTACSSGSSGGGAGGFTATTLDPSGAAVGSGPLTVEVRGTGFFGGLEVQVDGVSQATTFVDATTLSVDAPASALSVPGVVAVRVFDPMTMTTSAELGFDVAAVPVVGTLAPSNAVAGSGPMTVRVIGMDFRPAAIAAWSGNPRPTTFVSDTELEMEIASMDLAVSGMVDVTVVDPFGGASNAHIFDVLPAPVLEVGVMAISTLSEADDQSFEMFPVHTGFTLAGTIDATGARVAWPSSAGDFVLDDTNFSTDVFLRDHLNGTTERVFLDAGGMEILAGEGFFPVLSDDGGCLAFMSDSPTLAPLMPGFLGLFVRDLSTGDIELASADELGDPALGVPFQCPDLSSDGRFVAFQWDQDTLLAADQNSQADIFVRDLSANTTQIVSVATGAVQANGECKRPAISQDGRYVVFDSEATNLTPAGNPDRNIYLHDRQTGMTELVSVNAMGGPASDDCRDADVSADGRYVVFESLASNLVTPDTNGTSDIFLRDRTLGTTTLVSRHTDGTQGLGFSIGATISADGQLLAFASFSPNLVDDDTNGFTDVFVHELASGVTRRVSVTSAGNESVRGADAGAISADGRYVVLLSEADDLFVPDLNGLVDLFLARTGRP